MFDACKTHSLCTQDALLQAEKICNDRGSRLTSLRKRVLELIWSGHEPVKAYDLLQRYQKEDACAKPPTIYRALDFLQEHGLIHKLHRLNAYIGCCSPKEETPFFILVCSKCHHVLERHDEKFSQFVKDIVEKYQFKLTQTTFELEGICDNCL